MDERKPRHVDWESWTERQIRAAQEAGEFDGLAASGKPIPDIDRPYDPLWWVKKLMEREKVSVLPRDLALRKRMETELAKLLELRCEALVRRRVEELNRDIARTNAIAAAGGGAGLFRIDADEVVAAWRQRAVGEGAPGDDDDA
jgi:hypothetical protein